MTSPHVFFLRDKKRFPVACIASAPTSDPSYVAFSVSAHNPRDPYNKHLGRKIAEDRLKKQLLHEQFPVLCSSFVMATRQSNVKQEILTAVRDDNRFMIRMLDEGFKAPTPVYGHLSGRVRKAASLWLKQAAERADAAKQKALRQNIVRKVTIGINRDGAADFKIATASVQPRKRAKVKKTKTKAAKA